jgi:hypothetical protein
MSARRKYVGPKKKKFKGSAPEPPRGGLRPPAPPEGGPSGPPSNPPTRPVQVLRHYDSCKEYNTYPTPFTPVDPILPLENDTQVVDLISSSVNPTLPLESKPDTGHVFLVDT